MRLNINLATEPYQDAQQFLARRGLAVAVLLVLAIVLVFSTARASRSWRTNQKDARALQKQIDAQQQQKAEVEGFLNRPENRETHERSEFLNQLIARKVFSWTEIFTDLEHIVPGQLAIQSIQPEVNDRNELEVHLLATSNSHDTGDELVRRLEKSPHFKHAMILSESRQQQGGFNQTQNSGWRFDITAAYIPNFEQPPPESKTKSKAQEAKKGEQPAGPQGTEPGMEKQPVKPSQAADKAPARSHGNSPPKAMEAQNARH